jgi:hypothetical protein
MEKIFRYIFTALCLTGCLSQIYRISAIYFSYETATNVRYDKETTISLPALTICTSKHYFVRREILEIIFKNESNEGLRNETKILNYLNTFSIKEQFKALQSAQDILNKNCLVIKKIGLNSTEDYMDCDEISPIRMSIGYNSLCFTIISQVNEEPDYIYLSNISKYNNISPLIQIEFPNYVHWIVLIIHSRSETIHYISEKSHLRINHNESEVIYVNYKKTLVELMPKPYSTSCVDYKLYGHNFRSDCIFKCKTNFFKKVKNCWPMIYQTHDSGSNLLMNVELNKTFNLILEQKCEKYCGLENDCLKEYFVPEYRRRPIENQLFLIYIDASLYPILTIKHSPKIQIDEFLCFITSIISLWFGFSVIMLSDICSLVLKKFLFIVNNFNLKTEIKFFKIVKISNSIPVSKMRRDVTVRSSNK